ncbi:tetratricopeptide repeat protein [Botrimarina hoheduenensis]|uniref:Tetratricopeptide repeat protein n=1 Tax=Botrimarina hoheduenensis TaxID=2528000 RepID=A0A5C5WBI8_9BACT|nr:tetratricopeptide repeat protein [Botrimarina hoheduenensis]TWT47857.1 Tetratricopeptide repeat protein [Botrimarina hoheduenensis]
MKYEPPTDDTLVGNLLRYGQDTSAAAETESAEDLFELFIEGCLPEADQEEFYRYLDANPAARQAASLYLASLEDALEAAPESTPTIGLAPPRSTAKPLLRQSTMTYVMAMAACFLLLIGAVFLQSPQGQQVALNKTLSRAAELAADGDFAGAQQLLDGVDAENPQARLLAARVALQERHDLNDPGPWSLLAYGYELGDAVPMDGAPSPEAIERLRTAKTLVEGVTDQSVQAELTRAWLALKQNDAATATTALERVLRVDPDNAAAHLARGVACFMQDDLEGAEAAFRRHLELVPDSFDGRISLAKCVAEQGDDAEAYELLSTLDLSEANKEEVRRQITVELKRLQRLLSERE